VRAKRTHFRKLSRYLCHPYPFVESITTCDLLQPVIYYNLRSCLREQLNPSESQSRQKICGLASFRVNAWIIKQPYQQDVIYTYAATSVVFRKTCNICQFHATSTFFASSVPISLVPYRHAILCTNILTQAFSFFLHNFFLLMKRWIPFLENRIASIRDVLVPDVRIFQSRFFQSSLAIGICNHSHGGDRSD